MHSFASAQPALLYLSPSCILSVIITASLRGETELLWGYDDAIDDAVTARAQEGEKGRLLGDQNAMAAAEQVEPEAPVIASSENPATELDHVPPLKIDKV